MRLLKNESTYMYQEIEVEYSFLWFKWKTKYRKIDGTIFRFKEPDHYYTISYMEHTNISNLFKITV